MKKMMLICGTLFLLSTGIFAQNSEKITELINTEKTTYGQAAYLTAVFTGAVNESATEEESLKALQAEKFVSENKTADDYITLSELSYIALSVSGKKGGLFYTLFPGPRYALRELKAKGVLPPNADPSATVTGRDTIAVFNGCLSDAQ